MNEKIYEMLMDEVNGIFCYWQEELSIETGDITPWDETDIEIKCSELADLIEKVLKYQKGE